MADDDDDLWGAELGGEAAPKAGVTKDTMRKARAMNPNLASQGTTTELLNKVKGFEPPTGSAPAAAKAPQMGELGAAFEKIEQQHKDDKKRAEEELAKAKAVLASVAPRSLERLLDLVIRLDPNLTSPLTQEILKSKTAFLNEVGFSVRRVLDRQLKKR